MKNEKLEELEEFEEFDNEGEDENGTSIPQEEEEIPQVKKKKSVVKEQEKQVEPQIQYVGIPRAMCVEEMMNKVFDEIQELKQMIASLLNQK